MARPFNLTAQLNVQGPAGIRPVVQRLKRELSGIKTDLKVDISPAAARNASKLNQQIKQLQGSLTKAASEAAKLSSSINSTVSSFGKLQGVASKTTTGMKNVAGASSDMGRQLGVARTEMEEFGRVSGLALRRFAGFTVASTAVFGFVRAVTEGVGAAVSFERELVKIAQVTGSSVKQLQGLSNEVTRISTTFGVASSDLIEVARTLNQAGLSADDTRVALEALGKSSLAPTFTDIRNTTEGAIASFRQFGIGAGQLEQVLGSINAVAGNFAVEADDIISVIRRTGGVFKAASGDIGSPTKQLNELAAVFTSVRATTRESAESIATGLRTILTRIQRPRTIDFLRQFNIELQNSQGQFIGAFNAFQKLSEGLSDLDPRDVRFSQIVEEIGGFRQVGKLIPAIQQFTVAQDALNVAQQGTGSLARDAATAQQALAVQVTKVREEFDALIRSFTESGTFKTMAGGALELASALISVAEAIKPVLPFLTIIGAVKGFGLARQFGSGFFGGIRAGGGAGGVGAGLAGAATGQRAAAEQATTNALTNAINGLLAVQKANTGALSGNTGALNRLSNSIRTAGIGRRGFNSGGLVPGAGSTDTVPAMLTPGEFVIRKSSVQKYGASTLAGINNPIRRNKGSKLPENTLFGSKDTRRRGGATIESGISGAKQKITAGAAFLQPLGIDKDIRGSVKIDEVIASGERARGEKFKFFSQNKKSLKNTLKGFGSGSGGSFLSFDIVSGSLPKSMADAFDKELATSISDMSLRFAQEEMGSLRAGFDNAKMRGSLKNFNFEQVSGNVFEAMVNASLDPFEGISKSRSNAPFDFPAGLGQISKKFGDKRLSSIPTDTKRTFGIEAIESIIGKIKAIALEFAAGQLLDAGMATDQLTALGTFEDKKTGKRNRKFFASGANPIVRKATGGRIPRKGTDSIPALLTPGEFVMSSSATKNIGTGTLQALNKGTFKGFNEGGAVKRFGLGDIVRGVGSRIGFGRKRSGPLAADDPLRGLFGSVSKLDQALGRTTVSVRNDTRARTTSAKTTMVDMRNVQQGRRRFVEVLVNGVKRVQTGLSTFTGGMRGGPGGPGGGPGFFSRMGNRFKGMGGKFNSTNLLLASSILPSMLPQEGMAGVASQTVTQGVMGGITASAVGLGPFGIAIGIVTAATLGFTDSLKEANAAAKEQTLQRELKETSIVLQRFKDGAATSEDLLRESFEDMGATLGKQVQEGRIFDTKVSLDSILKAASKDNEKLEGITDQNFSNTLKKFPKEVDLAFATFASKTQPAALAQTAEALLGRFATEGESFNPQALSKAIGDQFTVQSELSDIISGDFEPKIQKGAAQFETALIKLASQTRRFITQDLQNRAQLASQISTSGVGNIANRLRSQFFEREGRAARGTERLEIQREAERQAPIQRADAIRKFNEQRNELLQEEAKRLYSASVGQKVLENATKLAQKEINLLAERLTTMSSVLKVVQGNFGESIRIERARAKAFEGNFEVAIEKNPLSKVLTNPRAFTQGQVDATLESVAGAFKNTFGPISRLAGEKQSARMQGQIRNRSVGLGLDVQTDRALVDQMLKAGIDPNAQPIGTGPRLTDFRKTPIGTIRQRSLGQGMADRIRSTRMTPRNVPGGLTQAFLERRNDIRNANFVLKAESGSRQQRGTPMSELAKRAALQDRLTQDRARVQGGMAFRQQTQSRIMGERNTLEGQLGSNLSQLLSGASQFTRISKDLPGILAEQLANTDPTSGVALSKTLAETIRGGGRGKFISQELADSIAKTLESEQLKRQGGDVVGRLEAGEISNLIKPIFENQLKVSTEITKILEGGVQEFVKATNDRINLEKKVIALNLKQQQKQAKVDNLRGTMRTGGFDTAGRAALDFENQIAALTIGTGVGVQTRGQFGTTGTDIGARLTEIARERKALEATVATDALSDPESAKSASDALVKLGVESNNLVTALGLLADSSADLAAIEAEKAKIESSAQGFQGLIRQVLTGNTEGAMGILRGAALSAQGVDLSEGSIEQNQDLFAFSDALGTVGNDAKTIVDSGMFAEVRATAQAVAGMSGRDSTSISGLLLSTEDRDGAFSGLQERLSAINNTITAAADVQDGLLAAQGESLRNIAGSVQENLITPLQNAIDSIDKTGKIGAGQNLRNLPTLPQQGIPSLPEPFANALQSLGSFLGGGGGTSLTDGLKNIPDFTDKVGEAATTIGTALGSFEQAVENFTAKDFSLKISPDSAVQLVGEGAFGQAVAEALVPTVTRIIDSRISQAQTGGPGATGEESTGPIGGAGGFRGF